MDVQPPLPPGSNCGELLGRIIARLKPLIDSKRITFRKDLFSAINDWSSKLVSNAPTSEEYAQFVRDVHDLLVKFDSHLRAMLLRVLRVSITSREHCLALIEEEVHWIVVVCLERAEEFMHERMQALKLMQKFLSCACDAFPPAFARSLVAIANHKDKNNDDNLRRVCLEVLRQLAVENPRCAVSVNGLTTLLETVLDPNFQDMAEPILVSFMYLLNDPKTRKVIRPNLDLHLVLAPFTDLDGEAAEREGRWKVRGCGSSRACVGAAVWLFGCGSGCCGCGCDCDCGRGCGCDCGRGCDCDCACGCGSSYLPQLFAVACGCSYGRLSLWLGPSCLRLIILTTSKLHTLCHT